MILTYPALSFWCATSNVASHTWNISPSSLPCFIWSYYDYVLVPYLPESVLLQYWLRKESLLWVYWSSLYLPYCEYKCQIISTQVSMQVLYNIEFKVKFLVAFLSAQCLELSKFSINHDVELVSNHQYFLGGLCILLMCKLLK